MARPAGLVSGWTLRLPKGRTIYVARITHNGATCDYSTGERDTRAATQAGARIYADHVHRNPAKRVAVKRGAAPPLDELLAEWLGGDATITDQTRGVREIYAGKYVDFFPTLADITEATATRYRDQRLGSVQAQTVRHELSVLRRFLAWCELHEYLARPVHVPSVPAKATGTKHPERRRVPAGALSPDHVQAVLAALPDWSTSRRTEPFPIRTRFLVGYETSLRPGALDRLRVPEHWQPGQRTLYITADIDKIRWAREIPLSDRAATALELVAPAEGLIFGAHDYREHIRAAALQALPPHLAATFTGTHLRSARITHALESPQANLPGVQYLAGQKQASTTARYVRPSMRAALEVVAAQNKE